MKLKDHLSDVVEMFKLLDLHPKKFVPVLILLSFWFFVVVAIWRGEFAEALLFCVMIIAWQMTWDY